LFSKLMREQFPTLSSVAVPSSGGVAFRIVTAMKPRYAGEARAALLAAMTANMRPKIVIVVDALPGSTLDPSVDRSLPLDRQTGSVVGIDATFPFGAEIRTAGARPVSRDICGPVLAEKGHEYIEVADVPGWREYEFPEWKGRGG
jgi:4-hydroxy-3-polyprenylbenzoate decarboxylase/2,5-furandicarboxylate decarboxylase 1